MIFARARQLGAIAAVLGVVRIGAAGAQAPGEAHWSLEGSRGGYCVWYLADPDLARKLVPSGTVLNPAGSGAGLPALLTRTVQDEPRFAQWIPGSICVGFYDRVTVEGRPLAQPKGGRPVVVATSSIAALDARGLPGTTAYLLDLMTDQRALSRAADAVGLPMSGIVVESRQRVEGDDPEISISIDGLHIIWSGHPIGESRVGSTRTLSFGYAGSRSSSWTVTVEATPASSRLLVGALQVVGNNALAQALKASPVRAIGPEEAGGTVVLSVQQAARR